MPKHVPTFKHLIATSHNRTDQSKHRERTVNERLAASRAVHRDHVIREVQSQALSSSTGDNVWLGETTSAGDNLAGGNAIHPAELLRRARVAHTQASRSVAGPAPPPSWRPTPTTTHFEPSKQEIKPRQITKEDLKQSNRLFSRSISVGQNESGPSRLTEQCFKAILRELNNPAIIENGEEVAVIADIMRSQIGYLSIRMKIDLLDFNSLLSPQESNRLSDKSIRALLDQPHMDGVEKEDDWDDAEDTGSNDDWIDSIGDTISHLPLMLHSAPASLLRHLTSMLSVTLTSLNLSYSTITDLERVVGVLPSGLRELSLCGVRLNGTGGAEGSNLNRGLALMSRKLIVLTVLDLSFSVFAITPALLSSMLHPPASRLPSLRKLGLRGVASAREKGSDRVTEKGALGAGLSDPESHIASMARRPIVDVVRSSDRQRFVEIIWD